MITSVDQARRNLGKRAAGLEEWDDRTVVVWGTVGEPSPPDNKPMRLNTKDDVFYSFRELYELDDLDLLIGQIESRMNKLSELWQHYNLTMNTLRIMEQVEIFKQKGGTE